ncbi:MAG: hypothetical protein K6T81_04175 [Alicyclobacillus macrosporangiidus]|uniref:hypothetical protein n=1 Tax=Alicyclobacillus macrosporangiidus TaxID=392015 RepID=UPI0026F07E65|nr:hypothetical protein [Alicyclobacillus macrosporangiidus]MCL6597915.1 hypothetical protein [Alicyclobacillus macrosporangiidus]
MSAKLDLTNTLSHVVARLYDYCAVDCANPWACEGCGVYEAKRELTYLGIGAHIPELMATLEPEQEEAAQQPMPYLVVIEGGRR